ncbi:MAG: BRCT domain-containing protein [Desulfovibrionaceae bacterium]|nr:BRCT domain-containing protein [Desulfovibrionaceae bacterium]
MAGYNDAEDEHGQPVNRALHARRLKDRGVDELLGICTGMIADGAVNEQEANYLLDWLNRRLDVQQEYVGYLIYSRVYEFLRDGRFDEAEKRELFELLAATCGHTPQDPGVTLSACSFFDTPPPKVQIDCHSFCLTGRFAYGTRNEVEEEILNLGGWVHGTLLQSTDFLVVGTLASRDWKHRSFGNKITLAVELRDGPCHSNVSIISEDWWAKHIFS